MSARLLQSSASRLIQSGDVRVLENSVASTPYTSYPMSQYSWTDRFGITKPDVSGQINLATSPISPTGIGNYTSLTVTADSTLPQTVGVAVILWDNRGNPISVGSGMITLSGWAKNSSGYFIPANGYSGDTPGFLSVDVSMAAGYTVLLQSTSVPNYAALGTVTTSSGSPVIVGTSTGFLSVMVGMHVIFSGDSTNSAYQIVGVTDPFHLTLSSPVTWSGASQTMSFTNPVNLHWRLF